MKKFDAKLGINLWRSIVLFGALSMLLACSNEKMREAPAENEAFAAAGKEKVFVSSAQVLPGVSESNEVRVVIKGNLPNPAYKIERYDVKVDGTNIEITPLAHHDKDMVAIQMLIAFEDTVNVKVKGFGMHALKVNGRSSTVKTEATIAK